MAKLQLKFYVRITYKFTNMPVKWSLKSYWAEMGRVLLHGLNAFPQKKINFLAMVNEF